VPVVPVSFVLSLRGLAGSDLRRRRRRKESLSDFCSDLRRDRVGLSPARPAAAHKQSDASRSSTVVYFSYQQNSNCISKISVYSCVSLYFMHITLYEHFTLYMVCNQVIRSLDNKADDKLHHHNY